MKNKLQLSTTILTLMISPLALAADDHVHDHQQETLETHKDDHPHGEKGPNGGQLIESKSGFTIEVVVDKDRMARILFLDETKKTIVLTDQSISGIAGERSAPTKLTFAKGVGAAANALIADKALPAAAHVPMILTIKTSADAKAVTERFELHLH